MAITKKVRFEVFKRDKFACQYCGRTAPDVILNVDHIEPRAGGGSDNILNLITSCFDCNQGKKDRTLTDHSVIAKQKAQLDQLQERREQLEMMMAWQKGLLELDELTVAELAGYWNAFIHGRHLSEHGLNELRKLVKKFQPDELAEAMRIAADHYLQFNSDGTVTAESCHEAWMKIAGICINRRREAENPFLKDFYYIRKVLRNNCRYVPAGDLMALLQHAVDSGVSVEQLKYISKQVSSWTRYYNEVHKVINGEG
jgi:HNH endonuclease